MGDRRQIAEAMYNLSFIRAMKEDLPAADAMADQAQRRSSPEKHLATPAPWLSAALGGGSPLLQSRIGPLGRGNPAPRERAVIALPGARRPPVREPDSSATPLAATRVSATSMPRCVMGWSTRPVSGFFLRPRRCRDDHAHAPDGGSIVLGLLGRWEDMRGRHSEGGRRSHADAPLRRPATGRARAAAVWQQTDGMGGFTCRSFLGTHRMTPLRARGAAMSIDAAVDFFVRHPPRSSVRPRPRQTAGP